MFSEAVLEHFRNPRNSGVLPNADMSAEVANPVCGDVLQLSIRIESGRIVEARFLCRGCTTAIACASYLTVELTNRTLAEARDITPESLSAALDGLPAATFHGAQLAVDALHAILARASS